MTRRRNRTLEELIDRIEDRLIDAPEGLDVVGQPASEQALAEAGLPEEAEILWRNWNGMELGNGEVRIYSLAEMARATAEADHEQRLRPGDRVIGEYGTASLVLPTDPWEEGGEVVMVEDDGQRAPYASSLLRLVLGLVAEMGLLYDEEGEYRDDLFASDGSLRPKAERRLLRRRLDFDEDAPFPRYRLGQMFRRAGERRAARSELQRVIHVAPQFAWAHLELGRAALELAEAPSGEERGDANERERLREEARKSFSAAVELVDEPGLKAHFMAWKARARQGAERTVIASEVLRLDPSFVAAHEAGIREALDQRDPHAIELWDLALAVAPSHLGLLALKSAVEGLSRELAAEQGQEGSDPFDEPDEVDRELERERAIEREREQRRTEARPGRPPGRRPKGSTHGKPQQQAGRSKPAGQGRARGRR